CIQRNALVSDRKRAACTSRDTHFDALHLAIAQRIPEPVRYEQRAAFGRANRLGDGRKAARSERPVHTARHVNGRRGTDGLACKRVGARDLGGFVAYRAEALVATAITARDGLDDAEVHPKICDGWRIGLAGGCRDIFALSAETPLPLILPSELCAAEPDTVGHVERPEYEGVAERWRLCVNNFAGAHDHVR